MDAGLPFRTAFVVWLHLMRSKLEVVLEHVCACTKSPPCHLQQAGKLRLPMQSHDCSLNLILASRSSFFLDIFAVQVPIVMLNFTGLQFRHPGFQFPQDFSQEVGSEPLRHQVEEFAGGVSLECLPQLRSRLGSLKLIRCVERETEASPPLFLQPCQPKRFLTSTVI